jgi:Rrf2 family transcriptional regulator, iron-sulfur cluster assembly transcription factor
MPTVLSQTAEYALRAAAWLAAESPDAPVRTRDLSRGTGIPEPYLAKILRRLVLAGILESRKGQGGGFALARPPERIRFDEVLEAVDAAPRVDRCAFGWGACDAKHPCPLHDSWGPISKAFSEWAAKTTLGDTSRAIHGAARRRNGAKAHGRKPR